MFFLFRPGEIEGWQIKYSTMKDVYLFFSAPGNWGWEILYNFRWFRKKKSIQQEVGVCVHSRVYNILTSGAMSVSERANHL